jgi:SAM-dependent methyltransferase
VPVVATRIAGVEDLVQSGRTGFLHERSDPDGLAESVLRILHEPGLRRELGRNAALGTRNFDSRALAEAWVDLLIAAVPEEAAVQPVLRPTLQRWLRLSSAQFSLLRSLEYESIRGLRLSGRTLDIGGGARNSYYDLLEIRGSIESVNLDRGIRPTCLADLNQPLPLLDETYDNIISLNSFEHVRDDVTAVREAFRVLKRGGSFHIVVPFLYRVHGSPDDHHRHTASWWYACLTTLGVAAAELQIDPLVWDPPASAFAITELVDPLRGLRKRVVMLSGVLRNLVWSGWDRIPNQRACRYYADFALGYYIHGRKNS